MIRTPSLHLQNGEMLFPAGRVQGRRRYQARFVRAGRVLQAGRQESPIVIAPEALQEAAEAGLFENKAVFVDHAAWFESPSLQRLVGVTLNSAYDPVELAVEGEIQLYDTPSAHLAAQLLDELLSDPAKAPDVGLSLVFFPAWEETGPDDLLITGIRHVESVDLVFEPAADGRVLQALSVNSSIFDERFPFVKNRKSSLRERKNSMETQTIPTPEIEPDTGPAAVAEASQWIHALADSARQAVIASSGLPRLAQERLSRQPFDSVEALQAAVEDERKYLAALQEDQVVQLGSPAPRSPQVSGMLTSLDRIQAALEALLNGVRPMGGIQPLTGIRELYHLLSGDYEMNGVFHPERIQFASVTSSTMASLVANALNKRVMAEFQEYPHWWEPVTIQQDFATLQAVKWITLGGVGELPTVAEGAAYTELSWDDAAESASFTKKGGYLGITLEAIDKDDLGRLQAAPRALAQAAWLTLSKAVSGVFTDNSGVGPTLSDSKALFHADHGNLGSSALSLSSYAAVRTAMRKQTELNSGERLGALTAPRFLLVPPDLEITALQILGSELDYSYALSNGTAAPPNPFADGNTFEARMNMARRRVIVVDLWTDTNNWAAVCDPRLYPTIGLGFRYGRTPEVFSVASPTAGLMFTNDTMPVKARFFFAVGPIDYRGLYKQNVA